MQFERSRVLIFENPYVPLGLLYTGLYIAHDFFSGTYVYVEEILMGSYNF